MGKLLWINAGIAVAAGVVGGVVGALLSGTGGHASAPPALNADSAHAQDVALCTTYALITAGMHHPIDDGADALSAIPPLRLALMENPAASPQVRGAISDAVLGFDAVLAKGAKPQGLSEPPVYDRATIDTAFNRVSQACGLDK